MYAEGAGCPTPDEWFCWVHHRHEPPKGQPFRQCFECGHVYESAEELVEDYRNGYAESLSCPPAPFGDEVERTMPPKAYHPLIAVETIYFCPLCLHDW